MNKTQDLLGNTQDLLRFGQHNIEIYFDKGFHDDPPEEKNSGSTTTHADISLPKYDSFYFDLSDTSLQLADKSDYVFEKFDDELAYIISPPEYD
ncbi:hypothetical protein Tco_1064118, partial [Tanacetum coccineum]